MYLACILLVSNWIEADSLLPIEAPVVARINGRSCPYCSGRRPIVGEADFATVHPELLDEWDSEHNVKYRPQDITAASHKELWWRCVQGHRWKAPEGYTPRPDLFLNKAAYSKP